MELILKGLEVTTMKYLGQSVQAKGTGCPVVPRQQFA